MDISVEAQQRHSHREEEDEEDASGEEEGVEEEEAEAGAGADDDDDIEAEGEDGDGEEDEEEEENDSDVDQVVNNGHSNGAVGGGGGVNREEDEDPERSSAVPPSPSSSSLAFPLSRVRRVIKKNDIAAVGMEAIFVIAKAAELFLEQFVEESYDNMCEDNRSSVAYKDLSSTVVSAERLEFLADFVPEKVPASRALAEAPFQIS